jgi:hypothetical protein
LNNLVWLENNFFKNTDLIKRSGIDKLHPVGDFKTLEIMYEWVMNEFYRRCSNQSAMTRIALPDSGRSPRPEIGWQWHVKQNRKNVDYC